MVRFEVCVRRVSAWAIDVEATSREDAKAKAQAFFAQMSESDCCTDGDGATVLNATIYDDEVEVIWVQEEAK
jgi:hypothetical protein